MTIKKASRLVFLDYTKGIAALLMILGHAEIFFNLDCYYPPLDSSFFPTVRNPTNFWIYIVQSSVDAFYFCAGVALGLRYHRAPPTWFAYSWPLIERGIVLIGIDLVIISWCYSHSMPALYPTFGSICCFGLSFVLLAFLKDVRPSIIALGGVFLLILREVVIIPPPFADEFATLLYGVFWAPVQEQQWSTLFVVSSWMPIIMIGYGFGDLLVRRRTWGSLPYLVPLAVFFYISFAVSRSFSTFGSLGQPLPSNLFEYFTLTKYPAGIQFHLLNLAFVFTYMIIGRLIERSQKAASFEWVAVCGRQIFFVYIFHLVLFGVVRSTLITNVEGFSTASSLLITVVTSIVCVRAAYFYEDMKTKYRAQYFFLKYV